MKKTNFRDLISGIAVMIIAAFFYWTTFGAKSFLGSGKGSTAPDTIPKAVAIGMFVLGALIVIRWIIKKLTGKLEPVQTEDDSADCEGMTEKEIQRRHLFQKITMPVTLVLIFLYILAMDEFGFTLSTFVYLTLQITLLSTDLSAKSWLKNVVIALVASLTIYIIFGCAFNLAVPKESFADIGLYKLYRGIFG